MQISRRKQFFIIFAAFFVLGASFKVMVLVEGFTEVRPVNAIPSVAGLISGPIGALACGLGNLAADLFGTFQANSVLGVAANFAAAFLPYRLWHIFSKEPPNLHHKRNILLYAVICLISAFTTAWILGFGLYVFFGNWIEQIYIYVFFNNFGFSIGLGMPLFILFTSDSASVVCRERMPDVFDKKKVKIPACILYFLLMSVIFVSVVILHQNPQQASWLNILSVFSLAGLLLLLV